MVGEVMAGERVNRRMQGPPPQKKKDLQDNSDLACVNMKKERE